MSRRMMTTKMPSMGADHSLGIGGPVVEKVHTFRTSTIDATTSRLRTMRIR